MLDTAQLERLPEEQRDAFLQKLSELSELYKRNPLHRFHACPEPCDLPDCKPRPPEQHTFLAAKTSVVAAFAGNRFGKTSALTVKSLTQCLPDELLPERLRQYRAKDPPVHGRIVGPDLNNWLYGVILPEFRKWTPVDGLLKGSFDGSGASWDKVRRILTFSSGSSIQFLTYEMDLDKFGGPALDFVGYDEPPPQAIRNECRMRLMDKRGFEMFAMTPLMGIGWIYRNIFLQKDDDDITVVKGSIHDNPHLDPEAIKRALSSLSKEERRSREFGEFAHFGGMVYPGGFEDVLFEDPDQLKGESWAKLLEGHDLIVGIDPGLKVAAFVWVAFDRDNKAFVVHERTVEEGTPIDYAQAIRRGNSELGLTETPLFVIDPSARNRSLINAESVESELQRQGIFVAHGQNQVLPGIQQVRRRIQEGGFHVASSCRRLRREALEYRQDIPKHRQEDEDDGPNVAEFRVVKVNDHHLDALRYACMYRPWYLHPDPVLEREYTPGWAPPAEWFDARAPEQSGHPMGPLT